MHVHMYTSTYNMYIFISVLWLSVWVSDRAVMLTAGLVTNAMRLQMKNVAWPRCSSRDKMLHVVFLVAILVMLACGAITVVCFSDDYKLSVFFLLFLVCSLFDTLCSAVFA